MGDDNPYEAAARTTKAHKLADLFIARQIPAAILDSLTDDGWDAAAQIVQVRTPSKRTRRMTIDLVTAHEHVRDRLDPADVLRGLP